MPVYGPGAGTGFWLGCVSKRVLRAGQLASPPGGARDTANMAIVVSIVAVPWTLACFLVAALGTLSMLR